MTEVMKELVQKTSSFYLKEALTISLALLPPLLSSDISRLGNHGLRVSVFGSKSSVFLAICGQIWQNILGTYEVKLKVYKISTNLVHRELRNATFEGKSH